MQNVTKDQTNNADENYKQIRIALLKFVFPHYHLKQHYKPETFIPVSTLIIVN